MEFAVRYLSRSEIIYLSRLYVSRRILFTEFNEMKGKRKMLCDHNSTPSERTKYTVGLGSVHGASRRQGLFYVRRELKFSLSDSSNIVDWNLELRSPSSSFLPHSHQES